VEHDVARILTIDLGTTYFKMSLFDRDGRLCDTVRLTPPTVAPCAGYMELPVDAFGDVIGQGIASLRKRGGDLDDVEAVTFATQTNSFVLLDTEDRALTPLILWPDRRAEELDDEVVGRCDVPKFSATTGIPRLNFQCMVAKLLWLQDRSRETWRRAAKLCLISDFLTLLLTGKHVTEAGAAALTGLVDVPRCRWWPEMLARFEIDRLCLPAIVRAGTDLGPIERTAAERLGLPTSCRFVVGCLDQYAGAIGVGNVEPGMISETTGTVLSTVQCTGHFSEQLGPAVLQGPAFRAGRYWRMTFGEVSANYLQWFRDELPDRPDFDQLVSLAEAVEPGASGLKLRPDARLSNCEEVFQGLMSRHTCGEKVRCILEAVAYALSDQMSVLGEGAVTGEAASRGTVPFSLTRKLGQSPAGEIRCAGGGARSELWLQIKADVSGASTTATLCPEPTSLGAAILAHAALSGADVRTIARQWVRLRPPHHPDPECHRQYRMLRCLTST
jgi:xylulokinase